MAISQQFAPGFLTILRGYVRWPYLLQAGLSVAGTIYAARRARSWLLFLAWPVLYFAAYSILGVSRYFWYYAPLVPGFIAAAGLGLAAFGTPQLALGSSLSRRDILVFSFSAAILVLLVFGQVRSLWRLRGQADTRFAIYQAVGEWLQVQTSAGDRVGALEVGIIGYYARRPMVDFAGLIQPQVAAQLGEQTNYEDAALWAVEHYRPEYLVLPVGSFPRLQQTYIQRECRLVEYFPGRRYGYRENLSIYACRK
jgi:hypothetical protein